jgi:hypothetical protein
VLVDRLALERQQLALATVALRLLEASQCERVYATHLQREYLTDRRGRQRLGECKHFRAAFDRVFQRQIIDVEQMQTLAQCRIETRNVRVSSGHH